MQFTQEQIALARSLRDCGLDWQPSVGHYVYDDTDLIEAPSPFHDRVFFVLDLKHFLRRAGTLNELIQRVYWLPQWHQLRQIARDCGINDTMQAQHLLQQRVVESGTELTALYRLLLQSMQSGAAS